jgi:hypothetical protein
LHTSCGPPTNQPGRVVACRRRCSSPSVSATPSCAQFKRNSQTADRPVHEGNRRGQHGKGVCDLLRLCHGVRVGGAPALRCLRAVCACVGAAWVRGAPPLAVHVVHAVAVDGVVNNTVQGACPGPLGRAFHRLLRTLRGRSWWLSPGQRPPYLLYRARRPHTYPGPINSQARAAGGDSDRDSDSGGLRLLVVAAAR